MPQHLPRPERRPDDHARTPRPGPPRRRGPRGAPRAEHAAHPGLDDGRDRDAVRARRDAPGPRPAGPRPGALPAGALLGAVLRPVDAHQVVLGRRRGAARRAGGHRRRLLHPGQPRRDLGGDRGDAGHERARPGHPARPDPGRGQPLHAGRQAGHRRLPGGDRRRARRARRQPPVRHRPPDPVAGRPAVAPGAVPGRPRGPDDHDELGLLAELRQAALGRAGHRHADDPVRGARPARPPRGLPAHGRPRSRPRRPTPRRRAARSP